MIKKRSKLGGKTLILILLFSFITILSFSSVPIQTTHAASGTYSEDFTTTSYMDGAETNATGWGTGAIENSKKKPEIVGSISSTLIGNTIDVFVDGDYAFVTNQGEGLKVVNITDPTNPYIIGTYDTNDTAQSVYVDGDYAFIADYEGISPQNKNFLVLDISDPTNPTHLGNCTTNLLEGDAAWDIVADGDVVYIANDGGGLCAIDISVPSSPEVLDTRNTPGAAFDIVVEGDYIYLADDSNGLVVLDVNDPTAVSIVATYNSGISSAVSVEVEGNYAYVADINNGIVVVNITDPTAPSFAGSWSKNGVTDAYIFGDLLYITDITEGLSVVNITDPTTPVLIQAISLPGLTQSIFIEGCYAYLACVSGGFQVVRIADPSPPVYIGSYDTPGDAWDVFVSGDFAYVADHTSGLQILNITDTSSPTLAGSYNTPNAALGIFVSGDIAYIADHSSGLQILNISNPSSPTYIGSFDTPDLAYDVFVSGDFAYVADWGSGLLVFNISNPSSPTLAGSYNTLGGASSVFVSGDFVYVADGIQGLQVLDISNPSSPTPAGSYNTLDSAYGVFVSGDYAYLTEDTRGLRILDISVPSSPSLTGTYNLPGSSPKDVIVSGDYAYLADSIFGLQVINLSIPSSPIDVGGYNTPGSPYGVFISGDYAYVADYDGGLQILEIRKNKARQFDSPCIAQSSVISTGSGTYTLLNANLTANYVNPVDTTLAYYLSADNGNNWESITPGIKHDFAYSDNQLKWKAVLTTSNVSVTPMIYDLSIDYNTVLDAPSLDTPIDGYITDDYTPTFTWSGINGESNYLFQLDTTTSFTTPLLNLTLPSSSTSYIPSSPLAIDTYYWRVAGIDSEGDLGIFSNYRSIIIIEDSQIPIIDHPNDEIYEEGTIGNFITWNPSDTNPYYYNITRNTTLLEHGIIWDGGSITIDIDGLSEGVYNFTCYVYDRGELFAWDSVFVTVEIPVIAEFTFNPIVSSIFIVMSIVVIILKKKRLTKKIQ